jgi:hypothetical protein
MSIEINENNHKHTRKGKIFRSSVVRSPKPNAGIKVSESNFSNVRPTIVITYNQNGLLLFLLFNPSYTLIWVK